MGFAHGGDRVSPSPESDEELLEAERDSARAFEAFYRRHYDSVLGRALRGVGDFDAAVDVTAEVFAAAYVRRASFDRRLGSARAWLAAITRHKIVDHHRRRVAEIAILRRLRDERSEPAGDSLEEAEGRMTAAALVAGLPAAQRQAVWDRVIDDCAYVEMARAAGLAAATMRKRVSDGLARLAVASVSARPGAGRRPRRAERERARPR